MARPQRNNVDYFPHYISDGKKMFIIESKFGNDGYAVWFKILETLAKTDDHWIDLQDESNLMYLAAKCRVSDERLTEIIDAVVKLGELDSELWSQQRVLWCQKFIDSIEDAYRKRSNNCINKGALIQLLKGLGRNIEGFTERKGGENTQSKEEDTKEEETKIKPIDRIPTIESFIAYGLEKASANRLNVSETSIRLKYEAWKESGWMNGHGNEIRNWKTSLMNTLPHLVGKDDEKEKVPKTIKDLGLNPINRQ